MTPPGTFERVYTAIKTRLCDGAYRPGARLEPAMLAEELNASVTPVRDALHRLTGERLVEAPRHEGFRAPMLTEVMLRQLYAWHLDLLIVALMKRIDLSTDLAVDPGSAAEGGVPNLLFERIVQAGGNEEHLIALRGVAERLGPVRRIEDRFLDEVAGETMAISNAIRSADRAALRRCLSGYHRRRQRVVPELLAELQRSTP